MNLNKIEGNGYRIGIPVPFPMKYVYCYLLPSDDSYVLIDTGYNYGKAREAWEEVFDQLTVDPLSIRAIYVTHFHPDHSGLAHWMQQKTGAAIYMHASDREMMDRVWGKGTVQTARIEEMMKKHGVPAALSSEIADHMDKMSQQMRPLPDIQELDHDPVFMDSSWQVLHTPGHSDGMFCLYNEQEQKVFSSDLILYPITPNISVWPGASQRPLHDYHLSLQKIKRLPVKTAYTAHGEPIHNVKERIDELIEHHDQRLKQMEELAGGLTAYQIASTVFAHRDLTPHQWRFAMAETIAHLHYLEEEKRTRTWKDHEGTIYNEHIHKTVT
ncbi:MBL fold metallo-hydrolase [Halobacillus naozhouensis]|uniref:MBL fold metallo-hydrolase n=1 Tax=Halobacillus naozhouensis TaxID=554880 RepID=A0ABY8J1S0_9BACI|nr:MBL fold metallo-hydrolase [Halobacillus naozhouensis]WFT75354.1 MBL fold metallo-hydrolase [Halobacillus naozhouensis]